MVRNRDGDGIKSNLIVLEVQKRPCLFDSNDPHYGDRAEKAKCWEEVCCSVVPGWSLLGLEQKFAAGKEIQKRWRSIRDSFTKSYRQGKCVLPEQCQPGSRRMQYHQQMAFLLAALQNKKPRFSYPADKYDSYSEVSSSPHYFSSDELPLRIKTEVPDKPLDLKKTDNKSDETSEKTIEINTNSDKETQTNDREKEDDKPPSSGVKINSILPEDNFDDDKLFMNSLVPLFKKMNDDTRLHCRIEVLKVIRYALQGKRLSDKRSEDKESTKEAKRKHESSGGSLNSNGTKSSDNATSLSMVTRSADGSRPNRKKRTRSPSPVPSPPKKRGPGRPRKVRPPSPSPSPSTTEDYVEDEAPKRRSLKARKPAMMAEPPLSDLDAELGNATSVDQLKTPTFMKMYNLERSKDAPKLMLSPSELEAMQVQIKSEPLDSTESPST